VFGAPGNPPTIGNPANSMNLGLIKPRAMTTTSNYIYVADATGGLYLLNRDGTYLSTTIIPEGVVSIAKLPVTFVGLATSCSVGWVGTLSGIVSMIPSTCGSGVVPGTYLAAAMVFEGSVHEIAVEGNNVYVLDDKFVWKTDGSFTSFTAVIGTEAASVTVPDGTDGLSYGLANPESLAVRSGILIVGEASRVLRFDPSGLDSFTGSLLIGASAIAGDPLTTLQAYDTTANNVSAVQFLDDNTVLFAEQYRDLVRVIDLVALTVAPVAGKEWVDEGPYFDANNTPIPSMTGRLFDPVDIVVGNNAVYVLQDGYSLIHRLN
jgi:hypothetical protein